MSLQVGVSAMVADGVCIIRAQARRVVDELVRGLDSGEGSGLVAAEGVALRLTDQTQARSRSVSETRLSAVLASPAAWAPSMRSTACCAWRMKT